MLLYAFAVALGSVEPREWIQLCQTGRWDGYHSGSGTVVLTEQDLRDMVGNFARDPRGRVVCDYEHQTLGAQKNGQPAPASGWITALELRPGADAEAWQLWGRVAWCTQADKAIRAQEYLYVSPVIQFRTRDRVTGAPSGSRLHSVALTNQPFFTELPAVAASDPPESSMLLLLATALGLTATATEEEVVDKVKSFSDGRKKGAAALGLNPEATDAEIEAAFAARMRLAAIGAAVCTEAGLADTLTATEAVAALKPRLAHAGYVTVEAHQRVVGELSKLRADQVVDAAIAAGKVVPATETWAREYAARDLAGFTAWVAATAPVLPTADPTRRPAPRDPSLSAEDLAVATQLGLDPAEFRKGAR